MSPLLVPSTGPPGTVALMNSPDAVAGHNKLAGEGVPNEMPARTALEVITSFPGRQAKNIKSPILFCICETDTVAPSGATKQYAAEAPKGEVFLYEEGHFDIYDEPAFSKVVRDQLNFLERCVPVSSI